MARADLSAMLNRLPSEESPTADSAPTDAPASRTELGTSVPEESTPQRRRARPPKPSPEAQTSTAPAGPAYLSLERKETRLRADQYADLTLHARRLSKAKAAGGERITENTLIRIAIDLLLARADDLRGSTEAELRDSVTP